MGMGLGAEASSPPPPLPHRPQHLLSDLHEFIFLSPPECSIEIHELCQEEPPHGGSRVGAWVVS